MVLLVGLEQSIIPFFLIYKKWNALLLLTHNKLHTHDQQQIISSKNNKRSYPPCNLTINAWTRFRDAFPVTKNIPFISSYLFTNRQFEIL